MKSYLKKKKLRAILQANCSSKMEFHSDSLNTHKITSQLERASERSKGAPNKMPFKLLAIRNSYINRCTIVQLHSTRWLNSSERINSSNSSTITLSLCCWCLRNGPKEEKICESKYTKKRNIKWCRARIHTLRTTPKKKTNFYLDSLNQTNEFQCAKKKITLLQRNSLDSFTKMVVCFATFDVVTCCLRFRLKYLFLAFIAFKLQSGSWNGTNTFVSILRYASLAYLPVLAEYTVCTECKDITTTTGMCLTVANAFISTTDQELKLTNVVDIVIVVVVVVTIHAVPKPSKRFVYFGAKLQMIW